MAPHTFDLLMQDGWRLLGGGFLRHNVTIFQGQQVRTVPLRVRLENFRLSKSQRKVLRSNSDLRLFFGQAPISEEKHALFHRHTTRFPDNVPEALHYFFHDGLFRQPVPGGEFSVFENERLLACSYVHVGTSALNGTYAFFEPTEARRSLGTFTMLLELLYAQHTERRFYYLGYAYDVPSPMDYKRNFHGIEAMDWQSGKWLPQPRRAPL